MCVFHTCVCFIQSRSSEKLLLFSSGLVTLYHPSTTTAAHYVTGVHIKRTAASYLLCHPRGQNRSTNSTPFFTAGEKSVKEKKTSPAILGVDLLKSSCIQLCLCCVSKLNRQLQTYYISIQKNKLIISKSKNAIKKRGNMFMLL